jgi:lipopolysaccharide/colanic/teichoic acid biosynthesis glycosyltransferase
MATAPSGVGDPHGADSGARRKYLVAKRAVDVIGAFAALIVLAPVMVIIAIAIKLDSRGPVFFVQQAIGRHSRAFPMLKFRTMHQGADNAQHRRFTEAYVLGTRDGESLDPRTGERVYKIVGDRRVTRVGRLLRRTGLDETPQFLNVLRGDMSLVGPRPPLPYEHSLYDEWAKRRLAVRPGITGLYQVRRRGRASFREMVETDLEYIERMSLRLDLKLLLLTIPVLVRGQGAY